MARKPLVEKAVETQESIDAVKAQEEAEIALAEAGAAADEVGEVKVEAVRVQAKFNRMRNPYTATVFTTNKVTDVIDLQSKENSWTRDQITAKVLEIVG